MNISERRKQVDEEEEFKIHRTRLIDRILLNRWNQLGLLLLLTAVITPVLVILFLYSQNIPISPDNPQADTCVVLDGYRVPCGGWINVTDKICESLGCCFKYEKCYHRIPSRYTYKWSAQKKSYVATEPLTTMYSLSYQNLNIAFEELSKSGLLIHVYNPDGLTIDNKTVPERKEYSYAIHESAGVEVHRRSDGVQLFSSVKGPLIASRNFWEMAVFLTNESLFGFGQLHLKGNEKFVFYNNGTDHNRIPIVMAYRNGQFHGLYIQTNSALEVEILPDKLIVVRSLTSGLVGFSFGLVTGGTPRDVVQQLQEIFGAANVPPYWLLGVHFCRENSIVPDIKIAIDEVEKFQKNADKTDLPYDSECIHENIFSFTMTPTAKEQKALNKLIKNIASSQKHFLMSLVPQILDKSAAYESALAANILYKTSDCEPYRGVYLGNNVTYPEYALETVTGWLKSVAKAVSNINDATGFFLRDNWPTNLNYSSNFTRKQFVYMNEDLHESIVRSIPWNVTTNCEEIPVNFHFESHNNYGMSFARQFYKYVQSERSNKDGLVLFTASHAMIRGTPFGIHNQNVNISWLNLKQSLVQILSQGLFSNPMISTPVCGSSESFKSDTQETLCLRWYLTAATLPVFRISSAPPRRDPLSLRTTYARDVAIEAIRKRYALLPYLNTVLQTQEPLSRPMFYDFYTTNETFSLDEQYMLGGSLLVAQILYPLQVDMNIYLPATRTWFEFWDGEKQPETTRWIKRYVRETDWIMYIAGGSIVPMHNFQDMKKGSSATLKLKPIVLSVALECMSTATSSSPNCTASGTMHVEKGVFLSFVSDAYSLTISNLKEAKKPICENVIAKTISTINIYGLVNTTMLIMDQVNVDLCEASQNTLDIKYNFQ